VHHRRLRWAPASLPLCWRPFHFRKARSVRWQCAIQPHISGAVGSHERRGAGRPATPDGDRADPSARRSESSLIGASSAPTCARSTSSSMDSPSLGENSRTPLRSVPSGSADARSATLTGTGRHQRPAFANRLSRTASRNAQLANCTSRVASAERPAFVLGSGLALVAGVEWGSLAPDHAG